jgi:hypothetical protein
LSALTGGVVPSAVIERLETWETRARGLTLRRLTVLSVADPRTLEQLTGHRSIRPLLRETLSSHHIAVDPDQMERLLQALRRRGHTPLVEPGALSSSSPKGGSLPGGAGAHLWLALRTYLNLADLAQLPAVPPAGLLDQLEQNIEQDELAQLASLAADARRRLADVIDGYAAFPAPLPDVDHTAIWEVVEQALQEACPLQIVYHTAGRGERTERVVEPLRLEEWGGARYLVAYCRLRQEERVFRLDRIETAVIKRQ